jgi:hypothetical protein
VDGLGIACGVLVVIGLSAHLIYQGSQVIKKIKYNMDNPEQD